MTHWKRLWCWEGLGAGGEGDDRGWDGWMASPTWWTWVWVNSGSWWWTGRPGVLQLMGSQRVGHDWATELKVKIRWGRNKENTTKENSRLERFGEKIVLKVMEGFSSSPTPKNMAEILTLIIHYQASESEIDRWLANWSILPCRYSQDLISRQLHVINYKYISINISIHYRFLKRRQPSIAWILPGALLYV